MLESSRVEVRPGRAVELDQDGIGAVGSDRRSGDDRVRACFCGSSAVHLRRRFRVSKLGIHSLVAFNANEHRQQVPRSARSATGREGRSRIYPAAHRICPRTGSGDSAYGDGVAHAHGVDSDRVHVPRTVEVGAVLVKGDRVDDRSGRVVSEASERKLDEDGIHPVADHSGGGHDRRSRGSAGSRTGHRGGNLGVGQLPVRQLLSHFQHYNQVGDDVPVVEAAVLLCLVMARLRILVYARPLDQRDLEVGHGWVVIKAVPLPPGGIEVVPHLFVDVANMGGIPERSRRHSVRMNEGANRVLFADAVDLIEKVKPAVLAGVEPGTPVRDVFHEMNTGNLLHRTRLDRPRKGHQVVDEISIGILRDVDPEIAIGLVLPAGERKLLGRVQLDRSAAVRLAGNSCSRAHLMPSSLKSQSSNLSISQSMITRSLLSSCPHVLLSHGCRTQSGSPLFVPWT